MSWKPGLSTPRIAEAFREVIKARGGKVTDVFDDGRRLVARSVLSLARDVKPRDRVQGGVAIKAAAEEVVVRPYLFRQVCSNGAIMAQTVATERVSRLDWRDAGDALDIIRETVAECCREEVFEGAALQMELAAEREADLAIMMMSLLGRLSNQSEVLNQILERFMVEEDLSDFGLMQAVTSMARDTRDVMLRWDLEELGGQIAAGVELPSGDDLTTLRAIAREEFAGAR